MKTASDFLCSELAAELEKHLTGCPTCQAGIGAFLKEAPPFIQMLVPKELVKFFLSKKGGNDGSNKKIQ